VSLSSSVEPIRPIDPSAWVMQTNQHTGTFCVCVSECVCVCMCVCVCVCVCCVCACVVCVVCTEGGRGNRKGEGRKQRVGDRRGAREGGEGEMRKQG